MIPGYTGKKVRYYYYRNKLANCGKNFFIGENCIFANPAGIKLGHDITCLGSDLLVAVEGGELIIGNNVGINFNVMINASEKGKISIGNDVLIASNVRDRL